MHETNQLQILQVIAGPIETNLFLVVEKESDQLLIVDAPPDSLAHAESEIDTLGATPTMLLITHTHWDHVVDAAGFRERYSVRVIAHEDAKPSLENPSHETVTAVLVDQVIKEGERLSLGSVEFVVLHTPGHAGDQISIYAPAEGVMFGGDTLFPGGYGRVDLPGSSKEATVDTMRKLLELPDEVTVYPGHGMPTTIGQERSWMERVVNSGVLPG